MRPRIGIGIGERELRAVMLRRQRVLWHGSVWRGDAEPLAAALIRLLSAVPGGAAARARVFAAVGPACAQVRRLDGLPPVADDRALATIVEQNADRFFLRRHAPLRTAITRSAGAATWAFAVDEAMLTAIVQACRTQRIRLDGVLPAVVVLGRAVAAPGNTSTSWADGSVVAELVFAGHVLQRARRCRRSAEPSCGPTVVAPLDSLAEDAWRFADAYGAAAADRRDPLLIRPAPTGPLHRRRMFVTNVATCALVGLSAAGAVFVPGMVAQHRAAAATTRLATLQGARAGAMRAIAQSAYVSSSLRQIQSFRVRRRFMTSLLAQLARSSPESTAFLTLHIDSAGGSFVALAPRAADVLESMDGLEEIAATRVVGAITRESAGAQQVERVAVRFRLRSRTSAGSDHASPVPPPRLGGR